MWISFESPGEVKRGIRTDERKRVKPPSEPMAIAVEVQLVLRDGDTEETHFDVALHGLKWRLERHSGGETSRKIARGKVHDVSSDGAIRHPVFRKTNVIMKKDGSKRQSY